jgi:hypothetical protein
LLYESRKERKKNLIANRRADPSSLSQRRAIADVKQAKASADGGWRAIILIRLKPTSAHRFHLFPSGRPLSTWRGENGAEAVRFNHEGSEARGTS